MRQRFTALSAALGILFAALSGLSASAAPAVYTFKGVNIVTDGSTDDVTEARLTEDITVTTSGDTNRKYAALTDLEHNRDAGTFPISESFDADGSYIYLACANVNDNAVLTLNVPLIPAGSRVTLTFAKPTVTNNGSTLRNISDPYAYLKIADRYISINGDNFDEWREESVVIGEDTGAIEFHCDKWGAVALSKIEISDGGSAPLHSVTVSTTRFANLAVNGIKFCADAEGRLTAASLPEGERVLISASKDGYEPREVELTVGAEDAFAELPLECLTRDVYYESDFGVSSGSLMFGAEPEVFPLGGVKTKPLTKIRGRVSFGGKGELCFVSGNRKFLGIQYPGDGIYVNESFITSKDNIEFEAVIDKIENKIYFTQNYETKELNITADAETIDSIVGTDATLEYIGISYSDGEAAQIIGADAISSAFVAGAADTTASVYEIAYPHWGHLDPPELSVSGIEGAQIGYYDGLNAILSVPAGSEGEAVIRADYNGETSYKSVSVANDPEPGGIEFIEAPMNLYSTGIFGTAPDAEYGPAELSDKYGNKVYSRESGVINRGVSLTDFSSSDSSVISINERGLMRANGIGEAVISASLQPGGARVSAVCRVKGMFIRGVTEDGTSYVQNTLTEDENISAYRVSYSDGAVAETALTSVPAASVNADGTIISAVYGEDGALKSIGEQSVSAGDKAPVSNGNRRVYLHTAEGFSELKDADCETEGFELKHGVGVGYEIAPVYSFTDIGDVSEGLTLDDDFAEGFYDMTFKKAETFRGDIFVNGAMVGNNVDQADADRRVAGGALYTAEDVRVESGKITVSMSDGSTMLDYVTLCRKPSFYERPKRVYVIGDSLACAYYGEFDREVGGGRSGWGQQLSDFLTVPVTNLANSGQYAAGLYATAFPGVLQNGEAGDICLIECGYNDRSYSTREEMQSSVTGMIRGCRAKGIVPILVTPNASAHDYKPSVSWSGYLRDTAEDTGCAIIDLSQKSYDMLHSLYGGDEDGNITKTFNLTEVGGDTLHSSYAGAYVWAAVVAEGLSELGYSDIVNTEFAYTFTDTAGNEITASAGI